MNRYLQLLRTSFGVSTSVMLVYRANVLFFLVFETLFLLAQFLSMRIGFDLAGGQIAGWTREQAYLLTAVNGVSHQLFICFFINPIFSLGTQVWNGQYDYILLKPLHPLASMFFNGQIVVSNLPNLLINTGVVIWLLGQVGSLTLISLIVFVVLALLGLVVRVALALLCVAPVFFAERLSDAEDLFWSVVSLSRFPQSVFPRRLELVLTYVIPVVLLASVPAGLLFGKLTAGVVAGAALAGVVFVAVTGMIFMWCLRHYQSVNSGV